MMSTQWLILLALVSVGFIFARHVFRPSQGTARAVVSPHGKVLAQGLAHHVRFLYQPATGTAFERNAIVHRIEECHGKLYFLGTCLNQRAPRIFRSDRVKKLIDLETGEIAGDLESWLRDLAGHR